MIKLMETLRRLRRHRFEGENVRDPTKNPRPLGRACVSRWLAIVLPVATFVSPVLGQPAPTFAKANDEFAKGDFKAAIHDYESMVQAQQWSAPLFYNLGNAYFRSGDFGKSILNYERALALEPQQPEAAANLALARDEARALELPRGRFDGALKRVRTTPLAITAASAFWITIFSVVFALMRTRRSTVAKTLAIVGCMVAVGSAAIVYELEGSRRNVAIVTGYDVRARLATADNASTVLQLPSGSEVRIVSRRGDWVYVGLPNNLRGWIPASDVEAVRL